MHLSYTILVQNQIKFAQKIMLLKLRKGFDNQIERGYYEE